MAKITTKKSFKQLCAFLGVSICTLVVAMIARADEQSFIPEIDFGDIRIPSEQWQELDSLQGELTFVRRVANKREVQISYKMVDTETLPMPETNAELESLVQIMLQHQWSPFGIQLKELRATLGNSCLAALPSHIRNRASGYDYSAAYVGPSGLPSVIWARTLYANNKRYEVSIIVPGSRIQSSDKDWINRITAAFAPKMFKSECLMVP